MLSITRLLIVLFMFSMHDLTNAAEVSLEYENGVYTLPVRINGAITLNFILDSGSAEVAIPVDVALTLLRAKTITETDFMPGKSYILADGTILRSPRFFIRELEIAGQKITDVPALIIPANGSLLLGQSLLKKLDSWSLDNKKHVLIIGGSQPGSTTDPSDFIVYYYSIYNKKDANKAWSMISDQAKTKSDPLLTEDARFEKYKTRMNTYKSITTRNARTVSWNPIVVEITITYFPYGKTPKSFLSNITLVPNESGDWTIDGVSSKPLP